MAVLAHDQIFSQVGPQRMALDGMDSDIPDTQAVNTWALIGGKWVLLRGRLRIGWGINLVQVYPGRDTIAARFE